MEKAMITFTAGILLVSTVRDLLKQAQFEGLDIEWFEGSGWIEREFIVKGPKLHVMAVRNVLIKCFEEDE